MNEPGDLQNNAERSGTPTFAARARSTGVSLAVLAALLVGVYYILGWWFTPLVVAILVVAIMLPLAFPYRYEDLVSALTWLGIAALAWFYFGALPLAVIAGFIGLLRLGTAIIAMRGGAPAPPA
jgi:hypothetical protein